MTTQVIVVTLVQENCIHCGFIFGMPSEFIKTRRLDHESFVCPSCRREMHYPQESDAEKAKRHLRDEQKRLSNEMAKHDQTRADLRDKELSRRTIKGQLTRIKNRIAKGVCPCCNRSFRDLARHMAGQHPEYPES